MGALTGAAAHTRRSCDTTKALGSLAQGACAAATLTVGCTTGTGSCADAAEKALMILPPPSPEPPLIPEDHVIQPKLLALSLKQTVPQLPLQSVAPQELALAQTQLRKPSTILPPPSPEPPLIPEDHVIQPKLLALSLKMPVPQLPLQSVAPQELALAQT